MCGGWGVFVCVRIGVCGSSHGGGYFMWERVVFYLFWVRVLGIKVCFAHIFLDGVSGVCVVFFWGVLVLCGVCGVLLLG